MGFFAFLSRSADVNRSGRHRSRRHLLGIALASACATAIFSGCAGELENPERFTSTTTGGSGTSDDAGSSTPTCPDVPQVLKASCGTASGCHGATAPTSNLDLASPDVGNRLKTQKATTGDAMIDSANPQNSVLYKKTLPTPPFGASMPLGGTPFDDTMRACLATWIGGLK